MLLCKQMTYFIFKDERFSPDTTQLHVCSEYEKFLTPPPPTDACLNYSSTFCND